MDEERGREVLLLGKNIQEEGNGVWKHQWEVKGFLTKGPLGKDHGEVGIRMEKLIYLACIPQLQTPEDRYKNKKLQDFPLIPHLGKCSVMISLNLL